MISAPRTRRVGRDGDGEGAEQTPVLTPQPSVLDGLPQTLVLADSTPALLQLVAFDLGGFAPNELVEFVIQSDPTVLGWARADDAGTVHANVTIPAGLPPGSHTLSALGLVSGAGARAAITVVAVDDGVTQPTSAAGFTALTPTRVFDTRPGEAQGAVTVAKQRYGGTGNILKIKITDTAGVPTTGVGAVSLNVTAIDPTGPGFVTVYPCGTLPVAANLNYTTGQIVPNAVIAPVSATGEICFYSYTDTHLVADINGWFANG